MFHLWQPCPHTGVIYKLKPTNTANILTVSATALSCVWTYFFPILYKVASSRVKTILLHDWKQRLSWDFRKVMQKTQNVLHADNLYFKWETFDLEINDVSQQIPRYNMCAFTNNTLSVKVVSHSSTNHPPLMSELL